MCRPQVEFLPNSEVKSDRESEATPKTKTDCGILPYARKVKIEYFDHAWSPLSIFYLERRMSYV